MAFVDEMGFTFYLIVVVCSSRQIFSIYPFPLAEPVALTANIEIEQGQRPRCQNRSTKNSTP